MSKIKRTYPLRLIKVNYTYTVEQIADLFGIDIATVRRWIRDDGLQRIPKMRPYLIHSSALFKFLNKRQKSRKKPCKANEAYCLKCRCTQTPIMGSLKDTELPNKTVRVQGKCSGCKSKINRVVRGADWSKSHPLWPYLQDATKQHNGACDTPLECNIEIGEQLCLNITP